VSGPPPAAFRFYLDEDVPRAAAGAARALGLDVVSADELGPVPAPDAEHLARAAAVGRIVVTYNRDDYLELTRDAFAAGRPHAGLLILLRRLPREPGRVAHALQGWAAEAAATWGPPPLQAYGVDFVR
jgi:predicted nuclease of predicted toxin-antitoxin system